MPARRSGALGADTSWRPSAPPLSAASGTTVAGFFVEGDPVLHCVGADAMKSAVLTGRTGKVGEATSALRSCLRLLHVCGGHHSLRDAATDERICSSHVRCVSSAPRKALMRPLPLPERFLSRAVMR